MNLIGTNITACSDTTTFERNKSVEEEALLKINDLLRRRRMSITEQMLGQHMQIMIRKM